MTNNDQHTIAEGLFIRWVESYGECEAKDIAELCDHDESLVQIVSDKVDRFLAFKGSLEPNDETDEHFVGKVIGQFELVRYISKGSYGVVYEARRTSNHDQRVAIKILLDGANSKNARARFYNECRTLAKLNHSRASRTSLWVSSRASPSLRIATADHSPQWTGCTWRSGSVSRSPMLIQSRSYTGI